MFVQWNNRSQNTYVETGGEGGGRGGLLVVGCSPPPSPRIFANLYISWTENILLKWKMVQNYKTRLHWTAQIFISGTKKVNYFKEVSDCLEINFPKLPLFRYFTWIYTTCPYKNVITWNDKVNVEDFLKSIYPKCGRFYKKI